MKFLYEYRTSDNVRHEGAISAATREAAFAALRERGIRPGRLVDAPGFFNKLFGRGKRWLAIAVLAVLVGVSSAYALRLKRSVAAVGEFSPSPAYVELERGALAILAGASNDVERTRESVKTLFRDRYMKLADDPRERQEAQTLYGSIVLRLEAMEGE